MWTRVSGACVGFRTCSGLPSACLRLLSASSGSFAGPSAAVRVVAEGPAPTHCPCRLIGAPSGPRTQSFQRWLLERRSEQCDPRGSPRFCALPVNHLGGDSGHPCPSLGGGSNHLPRAKCLGVCRQPPCVSAWQVVTRTYRKLRAVKNMGVRGGPESASPHSGSPHFKIREAVSIVCGIRVLFFEPPQMTQGRVCCRLPQEPDTLLFICFHMYCFGM